MNKTIYVADIETILYNKYHQPYAVGIYKIGKSKIYRLTNDQKNFEFKAHRLILRAFLDIYLSELHLIKKKKDTIYFFKPTVTVIFHNLSGFDGIFILAAFFKFDGIKLFTNSLIKIIGKNVGVFVKPLIRDNKIYAINIMINYKNKQYTIIKIIDSYLILPYSLNKLGLTFLNTPKLDFDHSIVNLNLLSDKSFIAQSNNYLMNDLKLTHDVFMKARDVFLKQSGVDIKNCLTAPSIAYKIFKKHFLTKFNNYKELIIELKPSKEEFIRKSYVGGHVEVYKPFFNSSVFTHRLCKDQRVMGKPMFSYDVNSLYPHAMRSLFPAGKSKFYDHEANFDLLKCEELGFIEAIISVPDDTYAPILPLKHKIENDTKLIFPKGRFKGIWYIEELKKAIELGYEIEVKKSLLFEKKEYLFREYVDEFYKLRVVAKEEGDYVRDNLYKLLLNSLYGRLGMINQEAETLVIPNEYLDAFLAYFNAKEFYQNDVNLLRVNDFGAYSIVNINLKDPINSLNFDNFNSYERDFINWVIKNSLNKYSGSSPVHLASAITAISRKEVAYVLHKYSKHLYYTDTDSVYLDCELEESLVSSNKIGLWKQENTIEKAVFLNPKTYAFIDKNQRSTVKSKGALKKYISFNDIYNSYINIKGLDEFPSINIDYPITKFFSKLSIMKTTKTFNTRLNHGNKRRPIYLNEQWVDTEAIKLKIAG